MPTVLAMGLAPKFADFSEFPNLTPELINAFINAQLERLRASGYEVQSCLVDLGDTAEQAHVQGAKICFNTTPADTVEAVQRWL